MDIHLRSWISFGLILIFSCFYLKIDQRHARYDETKSYENPLMVEFKTSLIFKILLILSSDTISKDFLLFFKSNNQLGFEFQDY